VEKIVGTEALELKMNEALRPYAMGLRDKLKGLPLVSQGGPAVFPDVESLIALKPQVILITTLDRKNIDLLQAKTRIPVVGLSYGELGALGPDFNRSLEVLGTVSCPKGRSSGKNLCGATL
jgi:iron complex transport system substrate-binding protein